MNATAALAVKSNDTALVIAPDTNIPDERVEVRRFMIPDLQRVGAWLLPRMIEAFPALNEHSAVGWLKGFTVNNEYLFLTSDNAVALAQLMPGYTLIPNQIVQERFVWAEDKSNPDHLRQAAAMYTSFYEWASKLSGIDTIVIDEHTDVPRAMIEKCLVADHKCRLLERKMSYARVKNR